jgi:hypothetical protein
MRQPQAEARARVRLRRVGGYDRERPHIAAGSDAPDAGGPFSAFFPRPSVNAPRLDAVYLPPADMRARYGFAPSCAEYCTPRLGTSTHASRLAPT